MKHKFDGYNYLVRLEKGEKLVESLLSFAKQQKIAGAWISAIGAVSNIELGFYDLNAQSYKWQSFDQDLEITSLNGSLAWEGEEPIVHLHGTFSDEQMKSVGGHIKEAEIAGTCELFIHVWNSDQLHRNLDVGTGLKLLDF